MPETLDYTTPKRKPKVIEFTLDGEDYHFTPPKDAEMVMPVLEATGDEAIAATRAAFDWLGKGLAEGEEERLRERLKDPNDDFDVPDLENTLRWVQKQVTGGRPTG